MPTAIPYREVKGLATPSRIFEFGDKIGKKLTAQEEAKQALRESSGKISGGKLGKPTLWAVLEMLGVKEPWSPYLLGKFRRGHDVEARAIEFLTGIDTRVAPENEPILVSMDSGVSKPVIGGAFWLQRPAGYRGGIGYIDLAQLTNPTEGGDLTEVKPNILHEVKSSTKMAYDKVAAAGRYKGVVDAEKGIGVPYYHHAIQLAYYGLGEGIDMNFLHYFNADDYRLTSFSINPLDYKEEIDFEIDAIQNVFLTKQLPAFEAFLGFHKAYKKDTYPEWNDLSPTQMMEKLERQFPDAHKKLMETTLETE